MRIIIIYLMFISLPVYEILKSLQHLDFFYLLLSIRHMTITSVAQLSVGPSVYAQDHSIFNQYL